MHAEDAEEASDGSVTRRMHAVYVAVMRWSLPRPWLALLVIVPLMGMGYLSLQRVESGFMPALDEGGFIIDYVAPPGTSLSETDRLLRQVEAILRRTSEVDTYSRRTGFAMGGVSVSRTPAIFSCDSSHSRGVISTR